MKIEIIPRHFHRGLRFVSEGLQGLNSQIKSPYASLVSHGAELVAKSRLGDGIKVINIHFEHIVQGIGVTVVQSKN
jgi:hypothetical protein